MSVNQTEGLEDVRSRTPGRTLLLHYTPPPVISDGEQQPGHGRPRVSALAKLPKYTAIVLDAVSTNDRAFKYMCAVFIVPQGMELDWLVSTPEGQAQVVAGAEAARVFLVTLNRGHLFVSAEEVQRELSPWIRSLVPEGSLPPVLNPGSIPYTTTPQGIGHRTVLLETASQINGPIVIEDIRLVEPGKTQPTTFRRMVFLDSPSLIQSEAVLLHSENESRVPETDAAGSGQWDQRAQDTLGVNRGVSDTASDALPRARLSDTFATGEDEGPADDRRSKKTEENLEQVHRKTKRRKAGGEEDGEVRGLDTEAAASAGEDNCFQKVAESSFDGSTANTAPRASAKLDRKSVCKPPEPQNDAFKDRTEGDVRVLAAASDRGKGSGRTPGRNEASRQGSQVLTGVDFSHLTSEYLQAMVAGLAFLAADVDDRTASERLLDVLVVGLGGGGMPMFLQRHLGCRVEVIEIDPTVVQLATTYFGVSCDGGFQVHVSDAISWIIDAAGDSGRASASKCGRGSFDAILIDVDSAGGQCPPPAFLDPTFLSATRCLLRPGGLVAMNVVTDDIGRQAVYGAFRKGFGSRLYEWTVPQNSNHVPFARRTSKPAGGAQPQHIRNSLADSSVTTNHESSTLLTCEDRGDVSSEDDFDLVYWASRLLEKGEQMRPWSRGPDLPELASNIRPVSGGVQQGRAPVLRI